LFFPEFQLRVYIYINILIQSIFTTLSNTVHSNYFSPPTITAKLFIKSYFQFQRYSAIRTSHMKILYIQVNQTVSLMELIKKFGNSISAILLLSSAILLLPLNSTLWLSC